ncbi:hypothetical protein CGSHiGG_09850 [Haemophilus influenzae PittGG]|uniref:Uncharacterized protein n=1 Tax=Haemophilus influenzae (strain PittGG) TaxID=374931 RepID=A5UIY1_HAEIG|nr:hypothetical protein CGSHiGG_09850 [Haemophilus influenzae PittGG]
MNSNDRLSEWDLYHKKFTFIIAIFRNYRLFLNKFWRVFMHLRSK